MWRYVLGIVCIHLPCLAISYCHMFHHDIHHNGGRRIWGRGNVKRNISIDSEQNLHIYTSMDSYWHLLVHKLCNVDVTSGVTSQYSGKWRHRGQNVNQEVHTPRFTEVQVPHVATNLLQNVLTTVLIQTGTVTEQCCSEKVTGRLKNWVQNGWWRHQNWRF